MKKYIPAGILFLSTLAFTACDDELSDINKNPNETENPQSAYLLTATQKHGADIYWGDVANYSSTLLFIQHWAAIQYTEADCYNMSNSKFTDFWDECYATLMTNLNVISTAEGTNENYIAVATIFRSWTFLELTDCFGDIPYSEAGKSVVPKYDTQKDVLYGLDAELKEAASSLNANAGAIEGDVMYDGNTEQWKRFANSLRLRIAVQLADREPEKAQTIIAEVKDNVMTSNKDIAQFVYTESPQQNPIAKTFETRDDYRVSKTMVDRLKSLSDPRLPVYAQMPQDETITEYVGVPNGLTTTDANSLGFAKTSRPGTFFLESKTPAVFMTYAEVLFNLSEAAARGFISGGNAVAESYYKQAITASLQQFGITNTTIINDYLNQASVTYDASNFRKSIGIQKWIAFYGQGPDAFTEWRRLDYPELKAGPANVLEDKMPVRFFYPGTEQSLNGASYTEAVQHQGADLLITKLWFDMY